MSRDERLSLDDILITCRRIMEYVENFDRERFLADRMRYDAVLHNLIIMGEAVKNLSAELREVHSTINWRGIAGFRDVAVHGYSSLDDEILWDIVTNEVPIVEQHIASIIRNLPDQTE